MSNISDLLLEKAASYHSMAESISEETAPEAPTTDSWEQIKQAAVNELVTTGKFEEATASSLIESLKEKFNA